jgi:hypothetical protein
LYDTSMVVRLHRDTPMPSSSTMSFFVSKQRDKQGFQPIHLDLKLLWEWDRTHRPTAWTVLLEDDIFS